MAEPTRRGGTWWVQRDNGSWLRFDEPTGTWSPAATEPPPLDALEETPSQAAPTQAPVPLAPPDVVVRRARPTIVLLWLNFGLGVIAVISDAAERSLIGSLIDGENVTVAELAASDDRQAVIGGIQFLLFVITAIFFLRWFSEAYRNVSRYGASGLPLSEGWAIGAWFVPVLNLFQPKRIANTIHRASDPELHVPVGQSWRPVAIPAIYQLWWAAWIGSNLLGLAARGGNSPTPQDVLDSSSMLIGADVASVLAALLAVLVVRSATERQVERHRKTLVSLM